MTDTLSRPNPGSPEAVALGCSCPVIDNRYGRGVGSIDGVFWYSAGCPVHWHGEISDRFPISTAINEKDD